MKKINSKLPVHDIIGWKNLRVGDHTVPYLISIKEGTLVLRPHFAELNKVAPEGTVMEFFEDELSITPFKSSAIKVMEMKIEYRIFSSVMSHDTEKRINTIQSLNDSGWAVTVHDINELQNGQSVDKHSPNGRNQLHIYRIIS